MKVALALLAGIFLFCICQETVESTAIEKVADDPLHEIVKRQIRRGFRRRNRGDDYNSYGDDRYDDNRYGDDYYDDRYDDDYYDDRDDGRSNRINRRRRRRF